MYIYINSLQKNCLNDLTWGKWPIEICSSEKEPGKKIRAERELEVI